MKKQKQEKKYYFMYKDIRGCDRVRLWTNRQAKDAEKNKIAFDLVKLG